MIWCSRARTSAASTACAARARCSRRRRRAFLPDVRGAGGRRTRSRRSRGSRRTATAASAAGSDAATATACSAAICTPGILMTMKAFLDETPSPTRRRFAKRSPAICAAAPAISTSSRRCSAGGRAAAELDAMTTRSFGAPIRRNEDARLLRRPGAVRRRRRASRHAARGVSAQPLRACPHPRASTCRAARARDGRRRRLYGGRPRRYWRAGAAAGAAAADRRARSSTSARRCRSPRTRCATSASRWRSSWPTAATSPRTRSPTSRSSSSRCRRWSISRSAGAETVAARVHEDVRSQRRRPRAGRASGDYAAARARADARDPPPLPLRPRRLVADRDARRRRQLGRARPTQLTVWDTTQAPVSVRNGLAAMLGLTERQVRRDRAVRRRRLRAEDHDVLPRGGADPLGGDAARPPGQVDRGPAGAFLRHHPGARADPRRRDRARRATGASSASRTRSCTTPAPTIPMA